MATDVQERPTTENGTAENGHTDPREAIEDLVRELPSPRRVEELEDALLEAQSEVEERGEIIRDVAFAFGYSEEEINRASVGTDADADINLAEEAASGSGEELEEAREEIKRLKWENANLRQENENLEEENNNLQSRLSQVQSAVCGG